MRTTFQEAYGTLDVDQWQAYQDFNVSPADHDTLVDQLGDNPSAIIAAIYRNSRGGNFNTYLFWTEEGRTP